MKMTNLDGDSRNFVLFRTDLFVSEQDEKDIDRWCLGGDCAGWFYARLLPACGVKRSCEPVMEDWGWTFAVLFDDVLVRINVWLFQIESCWLLGLKPENRMFRRHSAEKLSGATAAVGDAIDGILVDDSRFLKHTWFSENPFDLNVKEF